MHHKKVLLIMVLALVAVFALAGCGAKKAEPPAGSQPSLESKPSPTPTPRATVMQPGDGEEGEPPQPVDYDDVTFYNIYTQAVSKGLPDYIKEYCDRPENKRPRCESELLIIYGWKARGKK